LKDYGITNDPFTELMDEIFGAKPNQGKLKQFFKKPIIKQFWCNFENENFINSKTVAAILEGQFNK